MAYCEKCGIQVTEGMKLCPTCANAADSSQNDFSAKMANINNTEDVTASYDKGDIEQNKIMAVLAYLGILVFVPLLAAKESQFARYHANQGLVLLIGEIAYFIAYSVLSSILFMISWQLGFLVSLLGLFGIIFAIFAIIGIINALNGKAKALPLLGKLKILK